MLGLKSTLAAPFTAFRLKFKADVVQARSDSIQIHTEEVDITGWKNFYCCPEETKSNCGRSPGPNDVQCDHRKWKAPSSPIDRTYIIAMCNNKNLGKDIVGRFGNGCTSISLALEDRGLDTGMLKRAQKGDIFSRNFSELLREVVKTIVLGKDASTISQRTGQRQRQVRHIAGFLTVEWLDEQTQKFHNASK